MVRNEVAEAETASSRKDSKTLCRIRKEQPGKVTQKIPINNTGGVPLKSFEKLSNRWKEHFQAILNCPESDKIHDFCTNQIKN